MTNTVIEACGVTLGLRERGGLVGNPASAEATLGGRIVETGQGRTVFALDSVSFEVDSGETCALVGRNGSGKSTLLRLLAGIYAPTRGSCRVLGRVSTLFTNQIGVNQNATGLENLRMMCLLLSIPSGQRSAVVDDAAAFSELGSFLDMPLRTYSTGMKARLSFGLATSVSPDVLLIDEIFGTGDPVFRAKARERVTNLVKRTGTVMMASHSMGLLREFCTTAIWLDRGRVRAHGTLEEVVRGYTAWLREGVATDDEATSLAQMEET